MNKGCYGIFFGAVGKRYYYCLGNGKLYSGNKAINGKTCPGCNRIIDGHEEDSPRIETRTYVILCEVGEILFDPEKDV